MEIINLVDVKKVYLLLYNIDNIIKFTSLVYVYKALCNNATDYEKGISWQEKK